MSVLMYVCTAKIAAWS